VESEHHTFLPSALDGDASHFPTSTALTSWSSLWKSLDRSLIKTIAGLHVLANREIAAPSRRFNPGYPARSQPLYWLKYPEVIIPVCGILETTFREATRPPDLRNYRTSAIMMEGSWFSSYLQEYVDILGNMSWTFAVHCVTSTTLGAMYILCSIHHWMTYEQAILLWTVHDCAFSDEGWEWLWYCEYVDYIASSGRRGFARRLSWSNQDTGRDILTVYLGIFQLGSD
jgi:hypothetical protein